MTVVETYVFASNGATIHFEAFPPQGMKQHYMDDATGDA
jgi:hypothetical protein